MPAWSSFEPPKPFVVRMAGTGDDADAPVGRYRSPTTSHTLSSVGPTTVRKCSVVTVYGSAALAVDAGTARAPSVRPMAVRPSMGRDRRMVLLARAMWVPDAPT